MLRRRLLNIPQLYLRRCYSSPSFQDRSLTRLIEGNESIETKVSVALQNNFFALAVLLSAKDPDLRMRPSLMQQIVRGLTLFDPRLVPVNIKALETLNREAFIEMDSADKASLVDTLIQYGDPYITRAGLIVLRQVPGGPVPVSALMAIAAHAKVVDAPGLMAHVWYYLRSTYPRTMFNYTSLIVGFLEMFSRNKIYQPLARQVAESCLAGELNPSFILSVAKTIYMLGDDAMAGKLLSKLDNTSPQLSAVLSQLDASKGRKLRQDLADLPAQELAGVVKHIAKRDVALGEQIVSSAVDTTKKSSKKSSAKLLSKTALCYQYIREGDESKFSETVKELNDLRLGSGVLLNVMITWELYHGTFRRAKRHYQNWGPIPSKQRAIALKALTELARKNEDDLQWVKAERSLHGFSKR